MSVLTSQRLRRILVAYSVNELGTWFGYIALALGVYTHTHSALATAALFIARGLFPALLAPVLVTRTERSPRRGTLTIMFLLEGVTTVGLAVLLWHFVLAGVLALVALDGILAVAATALIRATAARIATTDIPDGPEAQKAREVAQRQVSAALNVVFMTAFAVGPAIGALLISALGGPLTLIANAVTFLLAGALLSGLSTQVETDEELSVLERLKTAWRHTGAVPQLRTLLIIEAFAIASVAAIEPVEVVYARTTLAAGNLGYGLIVAIWGTGAALSAVAFARASHESLAPTLIGGMFLLALACLGYAGAPTLALACCAAFVGGIGNGMHYPSVIAVVQKLTPSELHGRLMSVVGSINSLCPVFGFLIGGPIAAATSPRDAMLTAGLAGVALTAMFLRVSMSGSAQPSMQTE